MTVLIGEQVSKKKKIAKKEAKKEAKALKATRKLQTKVEKALANNGKVKSKCCKKYKKCESKRCGKCPCFDLFKKVA